MVSKPYRSIRKNSEFLDLKNNGQKIWASSWLLISIAESRDEICQLGISISRKTGNAVVRNKIKRWIRVEMSRFLKRTQPQKLRMTFFIKPMGPDFYKRLSFDTFQKAIINGIKQIEKNRHFKSNEIK